MKWILIIFLSNIILYNCLICEDVIRPKNKKECFQRTFVGEFNITNAYCCFLNFDKAGININKCSIHFKEEIDDEAVYGTIDFLKNANTNYENEEVNINSLDCNNNYIRISIILFLYILLL